MIHLVRKPVQGTVAKNALQWGTGGLNIDGCRLSYTQDSLNPATNPLYRKLAGYKNVNARDDSSSSYQLKDGSGDRNPNALGRWPSNVILGHLDGCQLQGAVTIRGNRTDTRPEGDGGREDKSQWRYRPTEATRRGYSDGDGTETVDAWDCVDGCPVLDLDSQSGVSRSGVRQPTGHPVYPTNNTSMTWNSNDVMDTTVRGFVDAGGASRFFKQVQDK